MVALWYVSIGILPLAWEKSNTGFLGEVHYLLAYRKGAHDVP